MKKKKYQGRVMKLLYTTNIVHFKGKLILNFKLMVHATTTNVLAFAKKCTFTVSINRG